jgi:hypothetical protein
VVLGEERFPQVDSSYGDQAGRWDRVNITRESDLPSGRTDEFPIAPSESADRAARGYRRNGAHLAGFSGARAPPMS